MAKAIELSIENVRSGKGGPFGAVIVKDGKIIAQGTNQVTSTKDPTAHAEIVAIRQACRVLDHFHLTGCEIYTTCEPCPMCMGAIYWARPATVYFASTGADAARFGFDDYFIFEQLQLPMSQRKIPMRQMMHDEALKAFPLWEQRTDKIEY
ncbi:MAG: nucleoside deaminase [Terriglobia bacterium]